MIAIETGWIATEVGRQPWIVQGLLKTKDAASSVVPAGQILTTLIIFVVIYALLFCVWFRSHAEDHRGPAPLRVGRPHPKRPSPGRSGAAVDSQEVK